MLRVLAFIVLLIKISRAFNPPNYAFTGNKRYSSAPLYAQQSDEAAFPLKSLAIGLLAGVGVFGTSIVGLIGKAGQENQQMKVVPKLKNKSSGEKEASRRGALTRLTRREINTKLRQIPVFFTTKDQTKGLAVYIDEDGRGMFFSDARDAEVYAKQQGDGVRVSVTTMDDVWYTLIEKKTKLGVSYITGVAGASSPDATYVLNPSAEELKNLGGTAWIESNPSDIPLYRIQKLAFQKEEGLEIPLFLSKADGLSSYERLQASKGDTMVGPAVVQETSLKKMLGIFSQGGIEGRALEFYPSADIIVQAAKFSDAREF